MILKQKRYRLLLAGMFACFSVVGALFSFSPAAQAVCEENAGTTDQCYIDNFNSVLDKTVSKQQYDQWVQNCRGKGGGLFGGGADEGSCANAVMGCINYAPNRADCNDGDKMAQLAGCQTGDITKENCKSIVNADLTKPNVTPEDAQTQAGDYCKTTYPQNTAACLAGQNNADCTTYPNAADKTACQNGIASNICGIGSSGSSANTADERRSCYAEVKNCLNKPKEQQQACITQQPLANPNAVNNYVISTQFSNCGQAQTVLVSCSSTGRGSTVIGDVLKMALFVLTTIVGIAAVAGLTWAALLYAKAEDNEGATKEAKELIRNIVLGIVVYGFMIAIVNWLVPGGVIG